MLTSTYLLRQRRFLPLFATQLFNAFNDNLYKNAMVLFVVYGVYNSEKAEATFRCLHGFSMQPTNINISVYPGIEHIVSLTPTQSGQFGIICNEFCGIGHHTMTGKIYVTEQKRAEGDQRRAEGR